MMDVMINVMINVMNAKMEYVNMNIYIYVKNINRVNLSLHTSVDCSILRLSKTIPYYIYSIYWMKWEDLSQSLSDESHLPTEKRNPLTELGSCVMADVIADVMMSILTNVMMNLMPSVYISKTEYCNK